MTTPICKHKPFPDEPEAWSFAGWLYTIHGVAQEPRECWECGKWRLFPTEDTTRHELYVAARSHEACGGRALFTNEPKAERHRVKAEQRHGKVLAKWHCPHCGFWHIGSSAEAKAAA